MKIDSRNVEVRNEFFRTNNFTSGNKKIIVRDFKNNLEFLRFSWRVGSQWEIIAEACCANFDVFTVAKLQ
jgi:hypothetical protein